MASEKQGIGCFGIVLIVLGIGWVVSQFNNSGSDEPDAPAMATASPAMVQVLRRESFCEQNASQAQIQIVVWFQNRDTADAKIDVLPVRYYNDGSENSSILDLVTVTIEAGRRQFMSQDFSYDAFDHDLVRCAVKIDRGEGEVFGEEIPLRVARGF